MLELKHTNRAMVCRDRICNITGTHGEHCTTCRGVISKTCKHCSRPVPMTHYALFSDGCNSKSHDQGSTEKCSLHDGKCVEYYCKDHSVVGCTACMTIDHRNCAVDYIPSIADEISGYDSYRHLDKALRDLGNKYEEVKKKSAKNVQKVENDFRRSLIGIRQLRKNVNTYFDKLESEVVKVLINFKDDEFRKLKTVSNKCVTVTAELNAVTSELEYKRQYGQQDQFFIAMKRGETALKTLQAELDDVESESKVKRFKYERSAGVSHALKNVTSLGDINAMKDPEDAEVETSGDFSVCLGTESRYCRVTGMVKLQDGHLVIADYNNKCVKLLDMEENKVIGQISTSSEPWDLTQTFNGRIAVTLPKEQKIALLSFAARDKDEEKNCGELSASSSQVLTVESELSVTGNCKGITKYGDRLIVTYCNPGKVEIIEMNGRVLRRIGEEKVRGANLINPEYVGLSPDQTTIYVSDKNAGKVLCFGIEGKLRGVYKDTELAEPGGVAVDRDGTVFVCDTARSEVHMLTPEGAKIRTILDHRHGLVNPKSIEYSEADDKVFVGTSSKGVVSTFTVK